MVPFGKLAVRHQISIPSRRVGDDITSVIANQYGLISIPSRRVGDQPRRCRRWRLRSVSIPSRRVGDRSAGDFPHPFAQSFHPLKAGRRLPLSVRHTMLAIVSIPSRRVGDPTDRTAVWSATTTFPSPQGGSETDLLPQTRQCGHQVSIPSRRVGDKPSSTHNSKIDAFPSPQGGSETALTKRLSD